MNAPAKFDTAKLGKDSKSAPSPAERLWALAVDDMAAVDTLITQRMQSSVGMIPDLASHLVGAGGKRLRPLLTIASARMCGYPDDNQGDSHHKLATAVEFIHTATLLHDDVVDKSALRRGQKPANLIWGNNASILVGDFLFARAFNLMVETQNMQALGILSNAASVIAEGEVQQLAALRNIDMTEAEYLEVISAKTAALFSAATEVAPVIAGKDAAQCKALSDYGLKLGLAFQLVDDALDYGGFESALGKSIGDDFREGKMTLPVIRAYANSTGKDAAFWRRVIVDHDQKDGDLERAISLLRETGALQSTLDMAHDYAGQARAALDIFPDTDWRNTLQDLADYVVYRIS